MKRFLYLTDGDRLYGQLDISDISNCDTMHPFYVVISTECDLGEMHERSKIELPPWGKRRS